MPEVVTVPPLSDVVPPAFVVRLAAVNAAPRVVVPVLLSATTSRALVPPTTPASVITPAPEFTVRSRTVGLKELSVEAKVTPTPVRVVSAFSVTASP